eukprot:scaffold5680_cov122-Isochrysis_galbana.AAC.1
MHPAKAESPMVSGGNRLSAGIFASCGNTNNGEVDRRVSAGQGDDRMTAGLLKDNKCQSYGRG